MVASFSSPDSAAIAKGMLETNGLHPVMSPTNMTTLYGGGMSWAPVEISVPAEEAEAATALLRESGDI